LTRFFKLHNRLFVNLSDRRRTLMPEVGEMAPDFELGSHLEKGKKVKLSDFRGEKNVVLAFYPLAWTPV
jgi:peroxiredoxin